MKNAEGVHPAAFQELRHPGAFIGKKAGRIFIAFGIMDICFLVRYVVIAHQDEIGMLFQFAEPGIEFIEPNVFKLLPLIAAGAAGEVCVDEADIAEIQRTTCPSSSLALRWPFPYST